MNTEMLVLTLAIILGLIQLFMQAGAVTAQRGSKWNMSSRDEPTPELTGTAGRIERAFENFKETFPFFLATTFLILFTMRGGILSQIGAWAYFICRFVYIPLYIYNVTGVRSMVWFTSIVGIGLMLLQLFVGS